MSVRRFSVAVAAREVTQQVAVLQGGRSTPTRAPAKLSSTAATCRKSRSSATQATSAQRPVSMWVTSSITTPRNRAGSCSAPSVGGLRSQSQVHQLHHIAGLQQLLDDAPRETLCRQPVGSRLRSSLWRPGSPAQSGGPAAARPARTCRPVRRRGGAPPASTSWARPGSRSSLFLR